MSKEVTKTVIKVAIMEMVDGLPVAKPLDDVTVLGNVSLEKAQKEMNKKFDENVTVFNVQPETVTYELAVEDFINIASVRMETDKNIDINSMYPPTSNVQTS